MCYDLMCLSEISSLCVCLLLQVLIPAWVFGGGNIRWQEELAGRCVVSRCCEGNLWMPCREPTGYSFLLFTLQEEQ